MREASRLLVYLIVLCSSLWLAACGGSSSGSGNNSASGGSEPGDVSQGRVFFIQPGPDATTDMVLAMIEAKPK